MRPRRVLVAHGDESEMQTLEAALEDAESLEVVGHARDGPEAVALFDALAADVIVAEVALPPFDGVELTTRILSAHPNAQVVIVSTRGDVEALARCAEAGASVCLSIDADESALAVLSLLAAPPRPHRSEPPSPNGALGR